MTSFNRSNNFSLLRFTEVLPGHGRGASVVRSSSLPLALSYLQGAAVSGQRRCSRTKSVLLASACPIYCVST